ncbi:DUF4326 domain-containing protein [Arthrobacter sp. zg-Y1110]|uniref:DUF4326 domain-containing protein n=1 Tax=Arthrobacter sp. zg-Y1110 TaxID=2886932 RepID=UPI001D14EC8F|nr:DUF4326 domain-containing protein [Arthrobacter sp. zg-Y1110]MCC3292383.1 DUF4326 domain-containing protein [Arthrobacter sp. zg-Y1110]UWX86714.1 DUF4326 domain-containing protein [Arthrobacter sp. zg-Y1110]
METAEAAPQRIKHQVGRALPANTALVGKGSGWATPFKAGEIGVLRGADDTRVFFRPEDDTQALGMFRGLVEQPKVRRQVVADLKGKNLACWCALDRPCHADILLEIANANETEAAK